jgi:hypothetical protein
VNSIVYPTINTINIKIKVKNLKNKKQTEMFFIQTHVYGTERGVRHDKLCKARGHQ